MNLEIALSRYKDVHERILPSIVASFSEEKLRKSFLHLNPPLWILWHMARSEDFGINRLAADNITVYDHNNWHDKLNTGTHKMGTGMTKDEVIQISKTLNPAILNDYRMAVYHHNVDVIQQIQSEDLSTDRDDAYLRRVLFEEDHLDIRITNILPVYQKKTRAWFVVHTLVAHPFYHIGQLSVIKQLMEKN